MLQIMMIVVALQWRFWTKHVLGPDPRMDTGSREKRAKKLL